MNARSNSARIAIGAVCGLAWAASLRAYMSEISGPATQVAWMGTFIGVLLPGLIVGGALGAATVLDGRSRRGRIGLRWCAIAVLAFAVFPMLLPDQLWLLLTSGLGGGAVGVALGGLAGGYAIGGRRMWLRIVSGVFAVLLVVGVAATVPSIGGPALAVTTPRGVWILALATSLLIVLMLACAIPFRRLSATRATTVDAEGIDRDDVAQPRAGAVQPRSEIHSEKA